MCSLNRLHDPGSPSRTVGDTGGGRAGCVANLWSAQFYRLVHLGLTGGGWARDWVRRVGGDGGACSLGSDLRSG